MIGLLVGPLLSRFFALWGGGGLGGGEGGGGHGGGHPGRMVGEVARCGLRVLKPTRVGGHETLNPTTLNPEP